MNLRTESDRLSPHQVGEMSDNELTAALVQACGYKLNNTAEHPYFSRWTDGGQVWYHREFDHAEQFGPQYPAAVLHVIEHLRRHWRELAWKKFWRFEEGKASWVVDVVGVSGTRVCGAVARDSAFPGYSFGRAVFEAALLSMMEERK